MRHDANGQKQSSKKSIGKAGASPAQRGLQLVFAQSNFVRIATSDRVRRRGYELDGCSHGWGREVTRHCDPIEATGCGDQPWEGALIEEAKAAGKYVLFNGEEHRGQAF